MDNNFNTGSSNVIIQKMNSDIPIRVVSNRNTPIYTISRIGNNKSYNHIQNKSKIPSIGRIVNQQQQGIAVFPTQRNDMLRTENNRNTSIIQERYMDMPESEIQRQERDLAEEMRKKEEKIRMIIQAQREALGLPNGDFFLIYTGNNNNE